MAKEGIEELSFLELQSQVKEIFSKLWKSFWKKYFAYLFIFINSLFHRYFHRFAGFIRPAQPTSFKRWRNLEFLKDQFWVPKEFVVATQKTKNVDLILFLST
jgi:hypothetical protein